MLRQLALYICIFFILWLFARDRKLRPMTSGALWVALLWFVIIGSRSVSAWLGGGLRIETPEDYLEGSPLDRNVFFSLIVVGLGVLLWRRVNWSRIFTANRWVFAFFLYCGISVIWSDYAFVSLKRWIKDFGNVIMVLIILTEKDPIQATKAVFARYTYLVIPLSIVFIKYFPELGRYYNRWTWEYVNCGVTTDKNALGCIALVCGLFLVWDLVEIRASGGKKTDLPDTLIRVTLLFMVFWLIGQASSLTALVCLILGAGILLFIRPPPSRRKISYLRTYILVVGLLFLLLYSVPYMFEAVVRMLGRDTTMTGRTNLWTDLISEPINQLIGTGYQSFWLGSRAEHYWEKYSFHPNQAHNGYLETYLNGGLIGVFLLLAMIISTGRKLKKELLLGSGYSILRFSFLFITVLYNWTEAVFNRMGPIWFILLITALNYPRLPRSISENIAESANDIPHGPLSKRQPEVPI